MSSAPFPRESFPGVSVNVEGGMYFQPGQESWYIEIEKERPASERCQAHSTGKLSGYERGEQLPVCPGGRDELPP